MQYAYYDLNLSCMYIASTNLSWIADSSHRSEELRDYGDLR